METVNSGEGKRVLGEVFAGKSVVNNKTVVALNNAPDKLTLSHSVFGVIKFIRS